MPSLATNDMEAPVAPPTKHRAVSKLHEFKEQLLLLSTLVATVTYVAGLNLPRGSWEQDDPGPGGHMAGDPILRDTHYLRYVVFYYCNATAFAASIVVSLILVILPEESRPWGVVLRIVMALDLLGLLGAYGAGSSWDAFTTMYAVVCFSMVAVIIIWVLCSLAKDNRDVVVGTASNTIITVGDDNEISSDCIPISTIGVDNGVNSDSIPVITNGADNGVNYNSISKSVRGPIKRVKEINLLMLLRNKDKNGGAKEMVDVLMLLTTFAVSITYVAGLSPPGGFWSSTQDGHRLTEPVLQASSHRPRSFFVCNITSFASSMQIIVLLVEKKRFVKITQLGGMNKVFSGVISASIVFALLGLIGAYAAGSCREAYQTALIFIVPVCVCLLLAPVFIWGSLADSVLARFKKLVNVDIHSGTCTHTDIQHQQNIRYLAMLLATLVVTITYQAGLDPPGGLWQDDRDGHKMGHPILQTTHPTRYKVYFYSNSAAFVTSLVVIMMLQSKFLLMRHTLKATLMLDLFCLVTAYGAGSTRDVNTSIYTVALVGLLLVYVIAHITIGDPETELEDAAVKDLDDKRKVLLLVAILAATLTYQAGLTPPGGFWLADDQRLGRRAGFSILLDNYPHRYNAFFYCNAASFMASVTLILLLVHPKLYRPGIHCNALYLCMLVGMFGLIGAYAAGSSRHLKTSIYVLILVGAGLASIASLRAIFWIIPGVKPKEGTNGEVEEGQCRSSKRINEKKDKLEYFMLLGILAASMTYQTGLKPPGGLWQDNNNGHMAGNPILHDINKHRYNVFFYSNSTSFTASITIVIMLFPLMMLRDYTRPLWLMHTTILLDMVGLLVAYAAGSTRTWEASRNVMCLIIPVLAYIGLYAALSVCCHRKDQSGNEHPDCVGELTAEQP